MRTILSILVLATMVVVVGGRASADEMRGTVCRLSQEPGGTKGAIFVVINSQSDCRGTQEGFYLCGNGLPINTTGSCHNTRWTEGELAALFQTFSRAMIGKTEVTISFDLIKFTARAWAVTFWGLGGLA